MSTNPEKRGENRGDLSNRRDPELEAKPEADGKISNADNKSDEGQNKEGEKKKPVFHLTVFEILIGIAVLVITGIIGIRYYLFSSEHEYTDDAYTSGHIHMVSPRVDGTVIAVLVDDNYKVHQGDVLVQLDPADFQVKVDKAQADYNRAKADFDRVAALKDDVAISKQDYDQTHDALGVAKAALDDARNQLNYCTIHAPSDGYIGRKQVEVGNRVTVGGALMAVVQDNWVVANYKETQLGEMKIGQRAEIEIDAIPNRKFYGTIDSFSPGSGSVFALLPPDNATGNFTKIVQRVPVKVVFDADSIRGYESRILPGLSVETTVDITEKHPQPTQGPTKFGL